MRETKDLSLQHLRRIVDSIRATMYIDNDDEGREIWNPDKEWSGADVCEHLAHLLSQYDLVPDRQELLSGGRHQYVLDPIDGSTFREQRELLLRFTRLASDGEVYKTSRAEQDLLAGLVNLTDAIADQAHDKYGTDCLLDTEMPCDCQRAGEFCSGVPGILARVKNAHLCFGSKVERCDQCKRYPSDEAARDKLMELGMA